MVEYSDMFLEELVRAGALDEAQAQEIMDEHERTGKPPKDVAVELGLVTADQATDVTAQLMGCERVDLEHTAIPAEVLQAVPGSVARMYNVIPIAVEGGEVTLDVPLRGLLGQGTRLGLLAHPVEGLGRSKHVPDWERGRRYHRKHMPASQRYGGT